MDSLTSVRIITVDYCMCTPIPGFDATYSEFRAAPVNVVPIVRVFGSKSTGEKICLHIHGVFPYFYIPYDGIEEPNSLMYRIASSIDKALNVSFNQSSCTVQHVYKVSLVSGIPMYGYHSKKHQFFKIYLYNPLLINKVGSLMFNETTLGQIHQPHETHLNFTLQFMIDYNLHGMNNINLSEVNFRSTGNSMVQRTTSCELEADAHSRHILNREEVCAGQVTANPGIAALWADERQRRRDQGGQSQLGAFLETSRRVPPTANHNAHKNALLERLCVWVTGVDKEEIGGNDSVYPAETPDGANIQHSSMIDSDLPSSSDISSLNESILNDTLQMSQHDVTMDDDALEMLNILKQLVLKKDSEIMQRNINRRQISKNKFIPKAFYIKLIDCRCANKSMPLLDEDYNFDDPKDKRVGKLSFVELEKQSHHPNLVGIPNLTCTNAVHTDIHVKKPDNYRKKVVNRNFRSGAKTLKQSKVKPVREVWKAVEFDLTSAEKEVKVFEMRLKRLNRRDYVSMLMKKIHRKDREMAVLLTKNRPPVFNVIPSTKYQHSIDERVSKVNAIRYAATRIANYIEPTLHLTVEYPTKQLFHYSYQGGRYFPVVQNISDANNIKLESHLGNTPNSANIENNGIVYPETTTDFKRNGSKALEKPQNNKLSGKMRKKSTLASKTSPNGVEKNRYQELEETLRNNPIPQTANGINEIHSRGVKRKRGSVGKIKNSRAKKSKYPELEEGLRNDLNSVLKTTASRINDKPSRSVKRKRESLCRTKNISKKSKLSGACVNNKSVNCGLCSCVKRRKCQEQTDAKICRLTDKINDGGNFVCKTTAIAKNKTVCRNCFSGIGKESSFVHEFTCKTENDLNESHESFKSSEKRHKVCTTDRHVAGNVKKIRKRQYLSLDGIIDSSDDENCDIQIKPKRSFIRTKSDDNSRYSALPISISQRCKSGKAAGKCPPKLEDAKRKLNLNYSADSGVNKTVIEERLDCIYSPVRRKTIKPKDIAPTVTENDDEKGKSPVTHKYLSQFPEIHNFGANIDDNEVEGGESLLPQDHNPDFSSDREISSSSASCDDEDLNTSFFSKLKSKNADINNKKEKHKGIDVSISHNEPYVSAAARYDTETNYRAKEGCSTVFTPPVSQKSTQSSEDSKIAMLTPYQVPVLAADDENSSELFSSGDGDKIIIYEPLQKAPSRKEVLESLDVLNIPHIKFEEPYYSNWEDVTGSIEVGYNVLMIKSKSTVNLPEFESQTDALNAFRRHRLGDQLQKKTNMNKILLSYCKPGDVIVTPVKKPPTFKMVVEWMNQRNVNKQTPVKYKPEKIKLHVPSSPGEGENPDLDLSLTLTPCSTPMTTQSSPNQSREGSTSPTFSNVCRRRKTEIREKQLGKTLSCQNYQHGRSCEITGLTGSGSLDFDKSVENLKGARAALEHQNLTLLVMELHVKTRGELRPDPAFDPIDAIFYSILNDVPENSGKAAKCRGAIVVNALPACPADNQYPILNGIGIDCDITYVSSEQELLEEFLKIVERCDPDIVAGYEIQMLSWGYLIDRGNTIGMNLKCELGRSKSGALIRKDDESSKDLKLIGRIILDVWRIMRHEIAIQSYTFESIVYHILQKRVPYYSFKDLTFWWSHKSNLYRHRTASYYLYRVVTILDLFDKLDLIGRTSELARLFGIQFYEVLSRGSQFRVESMMLRLAKPLNFIPVSPSVQQRAHMHAPEYIPLLLEPESRMYNDPVIVLDFQSLYPSIIIAYNYCFTTCLGRVQSLGRNTPFKFGATQLKVSRARLEMLLKKDLLNFSPLMVKNSMKENKGDNFRQKVLHNRQLGLKLIANVTYGYTAANFSGRMPAVEVGDSVVSKGRETLQRAIDLVENIPEWGAKVVYGDTDSLFVCVPGRSKERAFEVGALIAEAVTNSNPDPVKLKLEKVYQPCILQTKKRYAGYMYETPDQKEPVFEAKGIETVRRDGCPAVSKKYTMRQFTKILAGRVSVQDLTFAKEYRGASGYAQRACVPALELARKGYTTDRRSEPRSGERVPYVVINGPPGLPVIKLVRGPRDLLNDPSLRLNAQYYITRVSQHAKKADPVFAEFSKKSTISQYFVTSNCVSCGEQTKVGICDKCTSKPQRTVITLMEKMRHWEQCYHNIVSICQTCTLTQTEIKCISLDCPVYYRRVQTGRDLQQTECVRNHLSLFDF
nr:unnamed protein product [Callosobruchus chinensis]